VLSSGTALITFAAWHERVNRNSLAGLEALYLGAHFHDFGSEFMAEYMRKLYHLRPDLTLGEVVDV
jgi:hypothetical protein